MNASLRKAVGKPAWIVLALGTGALFPQLKCNAVVSVSLMLMLTMNFMRLDFRRMRPHPTHAILLILNILFAIGPFLLLRPLNPALAEAAFWTGIAPTAISAAVFTGFLGGSESYVLTSFLFSNILIPMMLPLLLPMLSPDVAFSLSTILDIARGIVKLVGVPLLIGQAIHWLGGSRLKRVPPRFFSATTFVLWVAMLLCIAANASDFIRSHEEGQGHGRVIVGIALMGAVLAVLNFGVGSLLPPKTFKQENCQSLGQKNTSLAICLALAYGSPIAALGPTFYVFYHNIWNAIQLFLHIRKTAK